MPEPTQSEFDAYSDSYRDAVEESIAFSGAGLDFFTRAKADALLELAAARVGAPEGLSFLDVGCGPGETDRFLRGRVARLAGVDVAPEMVERARERNPWAEYRGYAAGQPIPFEDGSFDVSFAICVFHHVGRGERVPLLREMARVTRAGRADRALRAQPPQSAHPQGGPGLRVRSGCGPADSPHRLAASGTRPA